MDDFVEIVPPVAIESPCTLVCTIDVASGLCLGCARTRNEIAGWSSGTSAWRSAVMAALPGRSGASGIGSGFVTPSPDTPDAE